MMISSTAQALHDERLSTILIFRIFQSTNYKIKSVLFISVLPATTDVWEDTFSYIVFQHISLTSSFSDDWKTTFLLQITRFGWNFRSVLQTGQLFLPKSVETHFVCILTEWKQFHYQQAIYCYPSCLQCVIGGNSFRTACSRKRSWNDLLYTVLPVSRYRKCWLFTLNCNCCIVFFITACQRSQTLIFWQALFSEPKPASFISDVLVTVTSEHTVQS